MESDFLERARATLADMRHQILRAVQAEATEGRDQEKEEPTDLYDAASDERERMLRTLLSTRERAKLEAIGTALSMIEEGSYGECGNCAEDISEERLAILPFTRLCVTCQSEREASQRGMRRETEPGMSERLGSGDDSDGGDGS